jgi:uncharacterized protein YndB with AHSA1/START domain
MNNMESGMIEQTLRIQARPETVWRFFTDPARLSRWLGPAELDARPGGAIRVLLEDGPRPVLRGEFVELVPHKLIVFTFGWEPAAGAPDIPPGSSRVEVTLIGDGDGTRLTLRHSGLPRALEGETSDGWAHFLRRLRTVVAPIQHR